MAGNLTYKPVETATPDSELVKFMKLVERDEQRRATSIAMQAIAGYSF